MILIFFFENNWATVSGGKFSMRMQETKKISHKIKIYYRKILNFAAFLRHFEQIFFRTE